MIISKHFKDSRQYMLVKFFKNNTFSLGSYDSTPSDKNIFVLFIENSSQILHDHMIYESYKKEQITLETILSRKYYK